MLRQRYLGRVPGSKYHSEGFASHFDAAEAALEGVAEITGIDGLRKRLVAFGYTKTMQVTGQLGSEDLCLTLGLEALESMEGNGLVNPAKPLILEACVVLQRVKAKHNGLQEFGAALCGCLIQPSLQICRLLTSNWQRCCLFSPALLVESAPVQVAYTLLSQMSTGPSSMLGNMQH